MINTKRLLLAIFLVLIPLATVVSSVYLISKEKEEVKGVNIEAEKCIPYIMNTPPRVAYVGQAYYFFPRIAGCEEKKIKIEIKGVEWLEVTEDMNILGVPNNSDIGTYKIEIYTNSGSSTSKLEDYIIVKEYEK